MVVEQGSSVYIVDALVREEFRPVDGEREVANIKREHIVCQTPFAPPPPFLSYLSYPPSNTLHSPLTEAISLSLSKNTLPALLNLGEGVKLGLENKKLCGGLEGILL